MKQMNRKRYLIMLGVIELAIFIYMIVLHGKGSMDTLSFVIGFFVLAAITLVGIVAAFYRYPWVEEKKEGGFDPSLVEVPRTREGTIFEALAGLILAASWAVAIATHQINGVDSYAIKMFVLTIADIIILCDVYSPGIKSRSRKYTNVRQVALDIRMCRLLAVEFALLVLLAALPTEYYQTWWIYILAAAFLVTYAIFRYLIYKAR
jgi:hypothetical protein